MMFALGLVFGIALSILVFLIELYLMPRKKGILQVLEKVIQKPKAEIFFPKTDEEVAQEELVDKNAKRGEGTPIEKLGL